LLTAETAASAYDDAPWIASLSDFCKGRFPSRSADRTNQSEELYLSHPNIKIFGSCFGHQLLCHALFSPPEKNVVCRDPKGYELGVQPISLDTAFLANFGLVTSNPSHPEQLRMQFVHADHVDMKELPEGFHSIGRSDHCALQGIWKKGRVLTYQGHAEFDRFINGETAKVFGKSTWSEDFMEKTLKSIDAEDDAIWAAQVTLRFFLEPVVEESVAAEGGALHDEESVMARL
jgi:GMP synthase-like glutamine amidotransferase